MGNYTEFHFNVELKRDVPDEVLAILRYMLQSTNIEPRLPNHPLFDNSYRWRYMLSGNSAYFPMISNSVLVNKDDQYVLSIRCNFKNYNDEISKFINWITPYLDAEEGDFLGLYRADEIQPIPTLIYYHRPPGNEISSESRV